MGFPGKKAENVKSWTQMEITLVKKRRMHYNEKIPGTMEGFSVKVWRQKEMKMKKFFALVCAAALSAALLAGCGSESKEDKDTTTSQEETKEKEDTEKEQENSGEDLFSDDTESLDVERVAESLEAQEDEDSEELLSGKHHAEIVVKDYGTMEVELDADVAPITVTNFVNLAKSGFYDGLTFHRIVNGFMIQGGDPKGNGTGGSDETIKGEFKSNGVENSISHTRGVISMARSSDPDSASSQFFIMQADGTYLDGEYAAFGEVTEGIEVVDDICEKVSPSGQDLTIPAEKQPVIETIKIVD